LTGVHSFHGDEILSALLVFVLVSENNFGERGSTSGVVHDVTYYTLDVTFSFREIESSEAGGRNSLGRATSEDRLLTLTAGY